MEMMDEEARDKLSELLMPDAEFNAKTQGVFQAACETLMGDRSQTPMLHVEYKTLEPGKRIDIANAPASVQVYVLAFDDMDTQKVPVLKGIARKLHKPERAVCSAWFISEAWGSCAEPDVPRKYAKPADDPGREELLMCFGRTIDGRTSCKMARIKRSIATDVVIAFENEEWIPSGSDSPRIETPTLATFWETYMLEVMRAKLEREHGNKGGKGKGFGQRRK